LRLCFLEGIQLGLELAGAAPCVLRARLRMKGKGMGRKESPSS
jgi:hypothetical protein